MATLPTPALPPWAEITLFGAGAAAALLCALLITRFLRRGHAHTRLGLLAVTLATAYAMEGMYEVAVGPLSLTQSSAIVLCAAFEVAMVHQGVLARHKLRRDPSADVRKHMAFVWTVAVASGVIASTASASLTEVLLRLSVPPLAAGIWYMSLYADRPAVVRQSSTWIWTPQRIGVRLGLLRPGSVDDLTDVFRQRAIARIVDVGLVVWTERQVARLHPDKAPSRRHARASRRLQRIVKCADGQAVAAARAQLRLTVNIEDELFGARGEVDDRTRDALDEIRLSARSAARELRSQHRAAFATLPWEPIILPRTNGADVLPRPSAEPTPDTGPDVRRTDSAPDRAQESADLDAVLRLLEGRPVPANRDVLAGMIRGAGMRVSNDRAGELLRQLRERRTV